MTKEDDFLENEQTGVVPFDLQDAQVVEVTTKYLSLEAGDVIYAIVGTDSIMMDNKKNEPYTVLHLDTFDPKTGLRFSAISGDAVLLNVYAEDKIKTGDVIKISCRGIVRGQKGEYKDLQVFLVKK